MKKIVNLEFHIKGTSKHFQDTHWVRTASSNCIQIINAGEVEKRGPSYTVGDVN